MDHGRDVTSKKQEVQVASKFALQKYFERLALYLCNFCDQIRLMAQNLLNLRYNQLPSFPEKHYILTQSNSTENQVLYS